MTRVVLRADASADIGSGHVMRSAALAMALGARGADVELLASGVSPRVARDLAQAGVVVSPPVASSSAVPPAAARAGDHTRDVDDTIDRARRGDADARWVVVDGYHFDRTYMQRLREANLRVAWIDDLNALGRFDCDLIINPTLGAERCVYDTPEGAHVLAGGTYALLRLPQGGEMPPVDPDALLVALGGADPRCLTPRVVEAVRAAGLHGTRVTVVVGPSNPHAADVRAAAAGAPNITVVCDPPHWVHVMAGSAMAVTAAGTMTWELASLGVPMVLLTVAENQRRGADAMEEADAADVMDVCGPSGLDAAARDDLAARLASAWRDEPRRRARADRARRLVDGRGAGRVARWIVEGARPDLATLRPARFGDAAQVWRIHSEPSVRAWSFDDRAIPLARHFTWFDQQVAAPGTRMYVLEREDEVAGVVRYERVAAGDAAELGIAVGSPFRRCGLGSRLLEDTWRLACDDLGVPAVRGLVMEDNGPSTRAFHRAGFVDVGAVMRAGRACRVFERRVA